LNIAWNEIMNQELVVYEMI